MKKSILILLVLFLCMGSAFAQVATYRDSFTWDSVPSGTIWATVGYDVAITQTNVTALQLGNTNGVPVLAGILGKLRVNGMTNTVVALDDLINQSTAAGVYTFWARTVVTPVGMTNYVVSDWTSFKFTLSDIPLPPTNIRIKLNGS